MQISWQLVLTVILTLIFLYLLYNAVKIMLVFHRAKKTLKTRRKVRDSMEDLHDDLDDLARDLKKDIK